MILFTFLFHLIVCVVGIARESNNFSVGFIHMRKAGGSLMLKVYDNWLREMNCFRQAKEKLTTLGFMRGVALKHRMNDTKTENVVQCPGINLLHNEFRAIDGEVLTSIASRSDRQKVGFNLTFFTTFRDPIQRICSQAFYGTNEISYPVYANISRIMCNETVPRLHLDKMRSLCVAADKERRSRNEILAVAGKNCSCLLAAWNETFTIIRTTPSVWFDWMALPPTLGDSYWSNYYIRRLIGYEMSVGDYKKAKLCASRQSCPSRYDDYDVLKMFFFGSMSSRKLYRFNVTQSLEVAKRLLKEQFDFVVLDDNSTQTTVAAAIRSSLFDTYTPDLNLFGRANAGRLTKMGVTYESIMPPAVLSRFREENAADIELYNYAVKLFHDRAVMESW